MSPEQASSTLDPDELAHLEEQRDFLLRSLADLEREHDAGDLDDVDFEHLRDDYTARAAEAIRAIDERRAAFAANIRPRDRKRTLLWAGGVALFAVIAGVAVAASLGARKAGETGSGLAPTQTLNQKANACQQRMGTDAPIKVINCFKKVLDKDPENVVANTWLAWELSLSSGQGDGGGILASTEARLLDRAVKADPSYSYARAFRAIIAYRSGDAAAAKRYLADFKANDPSAEALGVIEQMGLEAKIEALAKSSTTSTTQPTTTKPAG
jgi:cytochrome c-type biogenesis protein CcmH/NrfG